MKNILLENFDTPPFSKIHLNDYLPAFEKSIEQARAEILIIAEQKESPTFENTIDALENSGVQLDKISSIFFNLNSAETNDEMQQIAQEISPLLSEFSNDILLNEQLFERIKKVYEQKDQLELTDEQRYLLEQKYRAFARNGANLPKEKQVELKEISKELAQLSLTFGQNVLAETNAYTLHLTKEEDIQGLPEAVLAQAANTAKESGKDGWIFTLQAPSYIPFMKYNKNRERRKEMYLANGKKAFQDNEFNNEENVKKIITLRQQRANLLGYPTHAAYVLEERMAKSPENVLFFLHDLLGKAKPFAEKEIEELAAYAKKTENIDKLMPWDHSYFAEKLKQERFDFSEEELKPYFKLENVLDGAFAVANKLFGLRFEENHQVNVYHKDVQVFDVYRNDEKISLLYADFFPRAGKRSGAWMTSFQNGGVVNGERKLPQISIVCNFTPSTDSHPSLLNFMEVTTLFHEFGHALHGMLVNTHYPSLAGTNVFWDFVELPSQFYENFCYEPEALQLFAKHYQTGEIIPQELIDKMKKAANFLEGYQTIRQLSFGLLDMAYHATSDTIKSSIEVFEKESFASTQLYPIVENTNMSVSFSHIFQGGYSSGYYSYKWAEVLDADAFAYFKENGIFNQEIAQKFYTLLSSGGTVDPMTLYENFRGQKPSNEALLKRAGLV
ncbi:M3 family metallopeptidase [Weeksella virosa]|uniref:Oligopeptidase A n=1 Tax=Weeksella virosa (strain ATCC 43766 / DSM 16922 / JCM 21250 / CCUG 30538 / CDC 9751 / IAM 14551 / NBRC 16016 / NCTC 11634 / CL345/78) TaxID=865938 RepID=F0NYP3_WEEVC|nr:M3 family metallopeptidase [Weeksella virosa]ADX68174.1 Oligopeptidase A [Weeksella virosa DSM 16922]MDK7374842.1 M3 family metallopeptidase [Weeksella virosa]MDK7675515.1 M3 family metallopeptidase [Weeksella virosa]VEH64191.1 Oligopeptidase A [Weeksella virosa]